MRTRVTWSDLAWSAIIGAGLTVELHALMTDRREHTLSHKVERLRDALPPSAVWFFRAGLLGAALWLGVHWAW